MTVRTTFFELQVKQIARILDITITLGVEAISPEKFVQLKNCLKNFPKSC